MKKLIKSPEINMIIGILALAIASTSTIVNGDYAFFDGYWPIAVAGFVFALALSNSWSNVDARKIKEHKIIVHWKNWLLRAILALVFSFAIFRTFSLDMLILSLFIGSVFWIAFDIMLNKKRGLSAWYITTSEKGSFFDKVFNGEIELQLLAKFVAFGITLALLIL